MVPLPILKPPSISNTLKPRQVSFPMFTNETLLRFDNPRAKQKRQLRANNSFVGWL
jgi:hypothetical protein